MGNVAVWADSFRYQPGGEFSGPFHYVNGDDAPPPESCEIIYPGDCPPEGCIVKAIGNYVSQFYSPVLVSNDTLYMVVRY